MTKIDNRAVAAAFHDYPSGVRQHLLRLREIVLDVANSHEWIGAVEETLKWGEPSYLVKGGSTIRLGAPKSSAEHFAMYFNCNTKLVDTFRELYSDTLEFEGNRAIVFTVGEPIDTQALRHCVELALRYHHVKKLPLLGACSCRSSGTV